MVMNDPIQWSLEKCMPKPSRFTVILLKACLTEWDAKDRLCGIADLPPLEDSIKATTRSLSGSSELASMRRELDLILTGPSDTSAQSARLLGGSKEVKVREVEDLRELDFGLWEGVQRSGLEERFPSVYAQWIAQPGTVAPPDGESLEMVQERVLGTLFKALKKLKSEHPVVGLVLRPYAWAVVKCWLDQRPLSDVWSYLETESSAELFSLDRDTIEQDRTPKTKIA